jgi:hypothetical protein
MFHQLVSHNEDIRQLVEKGYALAFDSNHYLVIRDIPYLDGDRKPQTGAIVSKFIDLGQDRIALDDHQIFFAGSVPHGLDGKHIPNLGGGPAQLALSDASKDVVVQRSFSNRPQPARAFRDFFEKIESYVTIISGPAIQLHGANPFTFHTVEQAPADSPFKVRDTMTSRAEIGDLASKFKNDVIALIGLGGTGAYLLDFLVKTPVREIRGFDPDLFHVHTAFRSPGRLDLQEFGKSKAEVYGSRYENLRTGLHVARKFIDASCVDDLNGVTFAFVCVDKGSSRAAIFDLLISKGIPFIDVGMGLDRKRGPLNGMLRATLYSADHGPNVREMGLADLSIDADDIYRTNIQIAELNALNACLAIIRFKQLRGYYFEEVPFYHLLFQLGGLTLLGNAKTDEN